MKCREGCEEERKARQLSCIKCWMRIPAVLLFKRGMAKTSRERKEATQAIHDWLAADDKRRAE